MGATATVGKSELAAALKWSRPTLDKRLAADPKFPVVSRGDQRGGWKFNLAQVKGYLAGGAPKAIDPAQLRDAVKPVEPAMAPEPRRVQRQSGEDEREATARNRKETAQADILEDKLALARGELLPRADTRQLLMSANAQLAQDLEGLPEEIVREFGWPDEVVPKVRDYLDNVRREWHRRLMSLLTDA